MLSAFKVRYSMETLKPVKPRFEQIQPDFTSKSYQLIIEESGFKLKPVYGFTGLFSFLDTIFARQVR